MKKLLEYLPFYFLISLSIGIMLQYYLKLWQYSLSYLLGGFALCVALLLVFKNYKNNLFFLPQLLITFVFIGMGLVYIQNPQNHNSFFLKNLNKNSIAHLKVNKTLRSGKFYDKYLAQVISIDSTPTIGKVLVSIEKDSTRETLKIDQQIVIKANFKNIKAPLNQHQFSYKDYLAKAKVYHQVLLSTKEYILKKNKNCSVYGIAQSTRSYIQTRLRKYSFSKDVLPIVNALVLGQRNEISKELLSHYTKAGAIHILAVSGLHVGVLLLIFNYFLKALYIFRNKNLLRTIIVLVLLWSFAFITGLSASVVRAVSMFSFVSIGASFKRKKHIEHSLTSSMLILLLIKPLFLLDIGFQLSYLAVFGIVFIQPFLSSLLKPKNLILKKSWQLITVSLAAQIGILPLSLYYFHQFPSLFLLSNLVIIPFLSIILSLGILCIVLACLGRLPNFIVWFYNELIQLMNLFVEWVSAQEKFIFSEVPLTLYQAIVWYLLIILFFRAMNRFSSKNLLLLLVGILIVQTVYLLNKYKVSNKNMLVVFHKNRQSIIGMRQGKQLKIYHSLNSGLITENSFLKAYSSNENVRITYSDSLPSLIPLGSRTIFVLDDKNSNLVEIIPKNIVIIIRNSPKLNLSRLLKNKSPKLIIADGSNYNTFVNKWQKSCSEQNIAFHYTGQGAYNIK
ncbi:MAG: ComEC/Rec2 family competence protein [Tenacibaculum sp.]